MTAELRFTWGGVVLRDGTTIPFGTLPLEKTVAANGYNIRHRLIPVPAAGVVTLWKYDAYRRELPDFVYWAVGPEGSGVIDVAWLVDTPTSTTNLAPTGSNRRVYTERHSCVAPWQKDSALARINTTSVSNHNAIDVNGQLNVLTGLTGANADGRIYQLDVRNPGDAQVLVREIFVD